MTKKDLAIANHNRKYNCCQSVVCSFSDEIGIDPTILFKASEGFGLGMGCANCTCGALSGVVMLAGLKNSDGNLVTPTSKATTYQLVEKIVSEFEKNAGSTICKELQGTESGIPLCSCNDCIIIATELAQTVLDL